MNSLAERVARRYRRAIYHPWPSQMKRPTRPSTPQALAKALGEIANMFRRDPEMADREGVNSALLRAMVELERALHRSDTSKVESLIRRYGDKSYIRSFTNEIWQWLDSEVAREG